MTIVVSTLSVNTLLSSSVSTTIILCNRSGTPCYSKPLSQYAFGTFPACVRLLVSQLQLSENLLLPSQSLSFIPRTDAKLGALGQKSSAWLFRDKFKIAITVTTKAVFIHVYLREQSFMVAQKFVRHFVP